MHTLNIRNIDALPFSDWPAVTVFFDRPPHLGGTQLSNETESKSQDD